MKMNMDPTRFDTPCMGREADCLYSGVYGEAGADFIRVLRGSPYEIAVLSRLLVHLEQRRKKGGG